jgi:hypothetical protein
MSKQLLFCVEADKRSKTDWVYIKSVIDKYYEVDNSISIKPIYMGGKTNYKRSKVISEIKTLTKQFKQNGSTVVLYCVDTDNWDTDPDRKRELEEVMDYCREKGYEFIWFCRDVEEVFWGSQIHNSDKTERAKQFRLNNRLDSVSADSISKQIIKIGCSNIVSVLNKYLRKAYNN